MFFLRILLRVSAVWLVMPAVLGNAVVWAQAELVVGDVCRVKGQEENTLVGQGLVIGLNGTGDDQLKPTIRSLTSMLSKLDGNVRRDVQGVLDMTELADTANVAMVTIVVTIPPEGAQQGDKLHCAVSAVGNASSLQGGQLIFGMMHGPRADDPTIYGISQGPIHLPDPTVPTTAVVYGGCKMETNVQNGFMADDKITLVLNSNIAGAAAAVDIADSINAAPAFVDSSSSALAKAIDTKHVEVVLDSTGRQDPMKFLAQLVSVPLPTLVHPKRVVLNPREGIVAIGEDVVIQPVAISHEGLAIEAGGAENAI